MSSSSNPSPTSRREGEDTFMEDLNPTTTTTIGITTPAAVRRRQNSGGGVGRESVEMMGPILRRKKVVSLPLGDRTFFHQPIDENLEAYHGADRTRQPSYPPPRSRQPSYPPRTPTTGASLHATSGDHAKHHQSDFMTRVLRRKQVSLDLLSPAAATFFTSSVPEDEVLNEEDSVEQEFNELAKLTDEEGVLEEETEASPPKKLFFPLIFAPAVQTRSAAGGHGGHGGHEGGGAIAATATDNDIEKDSESTSSALAADKQGMDVFDDSSIIKATKKDKIKTFILMILMIAFVGVSVGWKTHEDESFSLFGTVGVGCVTDCDGNPDNRDFFLGHSELHENNVIQLIMHLDPSPQFSGKDVNVNIIRLPDNTTVHSTTFGPIHHDERQSFEEKINVDWETDGNVHVIDVISKSGDKISFTLAALVMNSLAKHSVLIAALIMILVYALILVEIIHRTLVAIFGSMVALFFFFIMHNGGTEGIATIMLHLEWSTLGLLFGMMIIVGELSHTGIFEWFAVRILVFSKGSFSRLIALLSVLTALASAFLDNVTTMLLLAPVTIDMCRIIDVDPRPYLIAEVLLSNVGGTATLIGDPPNIIIGSSFDEIGFVDFIIHILPCIFILCVPVSILLVIWIYKPYLTMKEMKAIDSEKLKRTYPVYDQPRLMIAGTTATFVILLFFLHPVHHKDTAWIALIGAFLTIAFTNPHDVQDALRNHVEWDTLLFFAGLFVLVEVCAAMGLLKAIGDVLANIIKKQEVSQQLPIAITLILWVSAITSAFLDNIPYTATMIPILRILHSELPDTLPLKTLAWALSFGACLGGNGTLLGASANIVTAGIATNKGYSISFLNFLYPGMLVMIATIAIANLYMAIVYVWI